MILHDGYLEVRPLHLEGEASQRSLLEEVEGLVRHDQLDEITAHRVRQLFGEAPAES
ncbi:MAG: hypothetical protein HYY05_07310 [Chloroflexi bacterium]|nr:hypothetical protein [Chloroflexota bacterium]